MIHNPLFLRRRSRFIPRRLVQIGKRVPEPIPQISRPAFLFLENGVLDDLSPERSVLLVPRSQSAVLFLCEWAPFLAAGFLEEGFAVWEAGADSGRKVGLGVWVVLFVRVWEVCSEPRKT